MILIEEFKTKHGAIPFDQIREEEFLPSLDKAIEIARGRVEKIKSETADPTFENTCEALEFCSWEVDQVSSIFFNLYSADVTEGKQGIAKEFSPKLTEFGNDIKLDPVLFSRIKSVYDKRDDLGLDVEQKQLLEKQYKSFVRNGANLSDGDKEKLRAIDTELSKLSLAFGDNTLAATNEYELWLTEEKDLEGLPESAVEGAKSAAKDKGRDGEWLFTLQYPSYVPFVTYAKNRELARELFMARSTLCYGESAHDNRGNIHRIVTLRHDRAKLLGYESHADFVLEERMASNKNRVLEFLDNLIEKSRPAGEREYQELSDFARDQHGVDKLERWDVAYYTELLKKDRLDFDSEELRPYFKLENVIDGVFQVAKRLYGLTFTADSSIVPYHPDVRTYNVTDEAGNHKAVLYADFFPRASKRSGAWMTDYRPQEIRDGQERRPHVSIVCNFTKPTETKPSLLTHQEVTTLFHEFGHALHGMLAEGRYPSLTGTNVYWDFVELPSQILENWCYEKECLDLFARHYETGELIPKELVDKVVEGKTFMAGLASLRQLGFGILDMRWHTDSYAGTEVGEFELKAMERTDVLPKVEGVNFSCSFGHIFSGGYSSGYYSYKWAEVLDADAFEYFKEKGIFNREVADSFKNNVLSRGGTEHPMTLYKRFRGQEPDVNALLRRDGLIA